LISPQFIKQIYPCCVEKVDL